MMKYVIFIPLMLGACASAASPQAMAESRNIPVPRIKPEPVGKGFEIWKRDFISRALQKGYSKKLLARTIGQAEINPKAIHRDRNQPEFAKPVWSYIDSAARPERVIKGKNKLAQHKTLLDDIEAKYGVDKNIIVAIWGLESAYGEIQGNDNMIDSLSTLAFDGRRRKFAENQLYAILDMLRRGDVRQNQLRGSWAGAMGQTQFIPTTFLQYAVDYDEDGNKDLWQSVADALGSTANYLYRHGWKRGQAVITEVKITNKNNADILFDGKTRTLNEWNNLGVISTAGKKPGAGLALKAKLVAPAGTKGPVFLAFKNFDVIKRYNNSTSYALGVHVLAENFKGNNPIIKDWPRADKALTLSQRKSLQRALNKQGYNVGGVDGIIGKNTRRAIKKWQKNNGFIPDGYVNARLLKQIIAKAN